MCHFRDLSSIVISPQFVQPSSPGLPKVHYGTITALLQSYLKSFLGFSAMEGQFHHLRKQQGDWQKYAIDFLPVKGLNGSEPCDRAGFSK